LFVRLAKSKAIVTSTLLRKFGEKSDLLQVVLALDLHERGAFDCLDVVSLVEVGLRSQSLFCQAARAAIVSVDLLDVQRDLG